MKLCSDVHTGVGTSHRIKRQRRGHPQQDRTDEKDRGDRGHRTQAESYLYYEMKFSTSAVGEWVGVWIIRAIMPPCGSILQVGTCQILSLAENSRLNRVWQKSYKISQTQ